MPNRPNSGGSSGIVHLEDPFIFERAFYQKKLLKKLFFVAIFDILCSIKNHCFGIIDSTNIDTLGRTDN